MTNDGATGASRSHVASAPAVSVHQRVAAMQNGINGNNNNNNNINNNKTTAAELLSKIPRNKLLSHRKFPMNNGVTARVGSSNNNISSNNNNNNSIIISNNDRGSATDEDSDSVATPAPAPVAVPERHQAYDAFTRAFMSQNGQVGEALRSLESLSARIGSDPALAPLAAEALHVLQQDDAAGHERGLGAEARREREAVLSSMALMRRLLVDAQAKFRRMVEENRQLGERIDGDVQSAHENVAALRAELSDTSQRLEQLQRHPGPAASMATALGPPAAATVQGPATTTSSSSSSPSFSSSVANSTTTSKSSNSNNNNNNLSDSPVNKARGSTPPRVTPRRPSSRNTDASSSSISHSTSGGSSSSGGGAGAGAACAGEADPQQPPVPVIRGATMADADDSVLLDKQQPQQPGGTSPSAGQQLPHLPSGVSDRIGKKLSAVGAEADKWAQQQQQQQQHAARGSLSLSPLDKLIVRPSSPKPGPSTSTQPDNGPAAAGSPAAGDSAHVSTRLKLENERLKREVSELRKLVSASGVSPGSSASSAAGTSPGALGPPGGAASSSAGAASGSEGGGTASGGEGGAPGFSVIADCDGNLRKVRTLESELLQTKEALSALKADRKRLKAEKFDLLNQMKQLYGTLEDKEKELRDFIRNYEQRMRESEASLQQLSTEREERERERWSLLRHARDEAERSLTLAAQLQHKDQQLQQLQDQLTEARRSGCLSDQESVASLSVSRINGMSSGTLVSRGDRDSRVLGDRERDRGSCSADSGVRGSSDRESGATSAAGNLSDSTTDGERKRPGTPTITVEGSVDMDSISVVSSVTAPHMYQHSVSTPKDCSPSLSPLNAHSFSRSIDNSVLSRSVEQLSSPLDMEPRRSKRAAGLGLGRGGTWGSISRVFSRGRHRKVVSPTSQDESCCESVRSWSPLTEEGYAEKLRLLREAASVPMERWRASTVLAWLEIALGMPQYGPRCAENVKSGKVLLELSDLELECGLGITHPMHRKKLRLAIEEHRHPALVRYPCIAQLTHTWVSSEWLPDLGLAQYSENFAANMVDARMLDHLSKKELEKFVGVTRKFHQASIVHGIHLLRMVKYDRQALAVRRHQSDHVDADPLVWTNQRFMRWARSIDLAEYADNLKDSGVHGALVVLEPSFNGDTMATALGIPPSKNIIRRHLAAELEALVLPARAAFEHYVRVTAAERQRAERLMGGGSLGRSYAGSLAGVSAALPQGQGAGVRSPGGGHLGGGTLPRDAERLGGLRGLAGAGLGGLGGGAASAAECSSSTRPGTTSPAGSHTDQDLMMDPKDRRRASLRTYSLLYLKKFSTWRSSQGSLSRALGLGSGKSSQRPEPLHHHHHHTPHHRLLQQHSEHSAGLLSQQPVQHQHHHQLQHSARQLQGRDLRAEARRSRDLQRDLQRERDLQRDGSLRHSHGHNASLASGSASGSASASASSSSENGSSSASSFACRSASPGASRLSSPSASGPSRPSGEHSSRHHDDLSVASEAVTERVGGGVKKRHRRVKSIGDIDSVTAVTPV